LLECDVLVVGAGPSGSSAARAAAMRGLDVILIEKKEKPGKIACGEAIASYLIPFLPIKMPKNHLIWKTNGMSFDTDDLHLERYGKLWEAYSIDRKKFDNWLAQEAVNVGAKLLTNTELVNLEHNNYFVENAHVQKDKENLEIKSKCIIAADGAESTVLKSLGLYTPKKENLAEIYSFELKNVDVSNPNLEQIYVGDYIDGGYAYVFPKSKNRVNIGVGSLFKQKNLEKSFEEFCELPQIKKQIKNGKKIEEKSGKTPIIPFLNKNFYGNVLLTGDAACQNFKPYAEGILPGVICGDICGKTSYLFLKNKLDLKLYDKKIDKKIGFMFKESDKITDAIYEIFLMKDLKKFLLLSGFALNLFSYKELDQIKKYEYSKVKKLLRNKYDAKSSVKFNESIQYFYIKLKSMIN